VGVRVTQIKPFTKQERLRSIVREQINRPWTTEEKLYHGKKTNEDQEEKE
tara:strand:+ start:1039 stop:1188 length:150 start_codon:yes stop_codon:yes gene_type:complete